MVVMGEGDNNDCWSLLAIVNESSRMTKTRAQLVINDNVLKTTTVPTTTTTVTLSPTPQLDYIEMDHSYGGYKSFFDDQFMSMNNSSGFWLPSTSAGVVTATPAAADVTSSDEEFGGFWLSSAEGAVTTSPAANVTSSEEELRGPFLVPYKPPVVCNNAKAEPVVVTGRMASKPLVEQTSRQHPRPRDSQMIPNQSLPAAVTRGCKKKKLENRRIVRLTEEELSTSDKWSWRKYGQKPIKGSQYPRNYYRCSTIKGCRARKQVERCPMNSKIYIVTYSYYHHHPYPPIRNTPGPRVRYTTKSNPPTKVESPTNTVFGPVGGTNGMITIDDEYVAGENSSFSSGETNEGYIYNNADFQVPVMNSMTYSELLTGTEQQNGERNSTCITINTSNNNNKYYSSYYNENNKNNNNVGYNLGCDPNVKKGVQVEENGSGYSVGNGEMYAPDPAPATTNGSGYGVGNREMYAPAPATNGPGYGVGNREMYAPAAPATNASGYGVGNGEMYAPAPATDESGNGFGNREIYAPALATANESGYGVSNRDMYAPAPATNGSGYGVANREMYAPAPATTNGSGYGVGNREMYAPAPAPSTNGWGYGVNNREMYAPAPATLAGVNQPPPNYVGQNSKHIWNIEMIKNSPGFFA